MPRFSKRGGEVGAFMEVGLHLKNEMSKKIEKLKYIEAVEEYGEDFFIGGTYIKKIKTKGR